MINFLGTVSRRTAVLCAGFLLGFMFYESDSDLRDKLFEVIHSSGITPETVAVALSLGSEWFSQQHNLKLQGK